MTALIFIACFGGDCREHHLLYADMPVMACLMAAQQELARWQEQHPTGTIKRWRCRPMNEKETVI